MAICKASSDNHFAFLYFFSMGMVLIPASYTISQTSVHSSSGTLSVRSNPLNLSLPLYNRKGFDLLLGRKVMTNLGSILKSRDITLPTKVCLVKAIVFPVVIYGCDSWTIKKAERRIIDAFELWCWRRLLRVPWTTQRSNQSILKEISSGCSLKDWCWSWNSNTLAPCYEELTHLKRPWCWERLKAGGEGDDRGWDAWMASPTQWTWVWINSGSWWWTGRPGLLQFMGLERVGHDWATELNRTCLSSSA